MKKNIFILTLVFLLSTILTGCDNAKKDVRGEWEGKNNKYIITKDTITYQYSENDKDVYNYEVVNDNGSTVTVDLRDEGDKKEESFAREKWTTYKKELKMYDEEGNVIEAYESEKPFDYKKWAVIICIIVAVVYGLYRLGNSEN